jgi:hypothetical protein
MTPRVFVEEMFQMVIVGNFHAQAVTPKNVRTQLKK